MRKKYKLWKFFFGKKNSEILNSYWPKIIEIYKYLEEIKIKKNMLEPVHIDMTPHNLLIKKKKILILDPDSFMVAPIGEAFAYAGLKICRQYIVKNKLQKSATQVGDDFIKIVNKNYSLGSGFSKNYYYLSLSYILERLVNIFRSNIVNEDKQWNNFLILQLTHIDEAARIFKK